MDTIERERNDALQLYIKNGEKFRKMELLPIFHEKSRSDPFQLILSCAETDLFRLIESACHSIFGLESLK